MTTSNPKIFKLKDLISALQNKTDNTSYFEALSKIQFGFKEIEHLCFWDHDNYSKISIENNRDFELVLICWENGQQSEIHNHDIDEAWTCILKGELTEDVYGKIDNRTKIIENTSVLTQKDISSIKKDSNKVHRLTNSYNGKSVSLHLYKK